jgi:hypothetical protein
MQLVAVAHSCPFFSSVTAGHAEPGDSSSGVEDGDSLQRGRWDYVIGLVGKPSAGKVCVSAWLGGSLVHEFITHIHCHPGSCMQEVPDYTCATARISML